MAQTLTRFLSPALVAEYQTRMPDKKLLREKLHDLYTVADANRLTIRLPDTSPSWWLLHELAHAMTSTYDGWSDGHGAKFMGLYAQLLTRYLRIPTDVLLESLLTVGIEVDMQAEPVFIDDVHPARASASSTASSISSSR